MSGAVVVAALIWVAVMIGFVAAWRLTPRGDAVEERLRTYGWQPGVDLDAPDGTERLQKYPLTRRLLMGLGLGPALAKSLMRADLSLTTAEFALIVLLVAALGVALGTWRIGLLGGIGLGILLSFIPFFYLRIRQARRLKALTEQIPDVMTLLVGGLRGRLRPESGDRDACATDAGSQLGRVWSRAEGRIARCPFSVRSRIWRHE